MQGTGYTLNIVFNTSSQPCLFNKYFTNTLEVLIMDSILIYGLSRLQTFSVDGSECFGFLVFANNQYLGDLELNIISIELKRNVYVRWHKFIKVDVGMIQQSPKE